LKGDIVEVLQFKDLIYLEILPTLTLEHDLEVIDDDGDVDWMDEEGCKSCKSLLINFEDSDDEP